SDPACRPAGAASARRLFFPPSYPFGPPASVVFTVWLSRIPALGVGSLSASPRTSAGRASWTRSQTPGSRHGQNEYETVLHVAQSCGSIRQVQPARARYRTALTISRNG